MWSYLWIKVLLYKLSNELSTIIAFLNENYKQKKKSKAYSKALSWDAPDFAVEGFNLSIKGSQTPPRPPYFTPWLCCLSIMRFFSNVELSSIKLISMKIKSDRSPQTSEAKKKQISRFTEHNTFTFVLAVVMVYFTKTTKTKLNIPVLSALRSSTAMTQSKLNKSFNMSLLSELNRKPGIEVL